VADIEDMDAFGRRAWFGSAISEVARRDADAAKEQDSRIWCVRCHQPITSQGFVIFDGHCAHCAYLAAFYPEQYDRRVRP
jgi:hypothetical protein